MRGLVLLSYNVKQFNQQDIHEIKSNEKLHIGYRNTHKKMNQTGKTSFAHSKLTENSIFI